MRWLLRMLGMHRVSRVRVAITPGPEKVAALQRQAAVERRLEEIERTVRMRALDVQVDAQRAKQ